MAWGHKPLPEPWSLGSGFRAQPQHASNTGALPAPRLVTALEGEERSPGDADWGREELGWWTHTPPTGQDRGCQAGLGPEPGRSQCPKGDAVVGSPQRPPRGSQQQRPPREESWRGPARGKQAPSHSRETHTSAPSWAGMLLPPDLRLTKEGLAHGLARRSSPAWRGVARTALGLGDISARRGGLSCPDG